MKKVDKEKYKVWVTYEEHSFGGEMEDPSDRYSSRSDETIQFIVNGVFSENDGGIYRDEILVNFDPKTVDEVHVLVVRYSTGDTFGHTSGCGKIEGVYKNAKIAEKIGEAIKSGYDIRDNQGKWPEKLYKDYRKIKGITDDSEYLGFPWEGYFERL